MDILFQDQKLEKICNDDSLRRRKFGTVCAKLLGRRLDDMRDSENLEEFRSLPQGRCHELTQDRKGTLAVDLVHPARLIFEPANDPIPRKPDGGLDWKGVTAVRILTVEEDYHGKKGAK
jgi:proteic killer suppression protein